MIVKVFCCYAHKDEGLLDQLKAHLKPLQRVGLIDIWCDGDINAGVEWEREISKRLNAAQIILLLISPDFMNSDYCYGNEMQRTLERHERGEAFVIPIILRHVYWQEVLGKLQALPKDGKPIRSWQDEDEAFFDVTVGIRKIATELLKPKRIDTSFMRPEMVLKPAFFAELPKRNAELQIDLTPDQWRLFTRADGQTTLQIAAQELSMSRDQVCQIAGELVALGVITLSMPTLEYGDVNELSPVSRENLWTDLKNNDRMTSRYATSPARSWAAAMPTSNPFGQMNTLYPIKTNSQWGNGGNGATFVLGNGWVVCPIPDQKD